MQKGINLFLTVYAVLIAANAAVYILAADNPTAGQLSGLGLAVLVFVLAFVAHRTSDAIGNPFNGLVLGSFKHIFLVWLGGLLLGFLSVGIAIGLGFVSIDPDMNYFLQMSAEQASKGGRAVSAADLAPMKVFFQIMALAGALVGPFLTAAFISLAFYPVYGWLGRRLLVRGLPYTFMVLGAYGTIGTMIAAFAPNPMIEEPNLALALPITALYGLGLTAVCLWLFLVSNSAVVPALAFAAFNGAFGACQLYYADPAAHMVPPMGAADLVVLLLVAVGLWLIKVPETKHMEVAAVGFDGSSLTSAQVAELDARSRTHSSEYDSIGEASTEASPPDAPAPPPDYSDRG